MSKTPAQPRLGYVIQYVEDVLETVAFYEAAFGLPRGFVHESGDYAQMGTGDTALAFSAERLVRELGIAHRPNRKSTEAPGIEIGLTMADVEAAFSRAIAAGAIEVKAPAVKPWGQTTAYVRDINGCLVELCTPIG